MSEAVPYDLTRPPPLKPRERAALRRAAARAAEMLATLATEYLGRAVSVTVADAGCEQAVDDRAGGGDKWLWVVAADRPEAPVWRIATPLASALVDIMVGGPPGRYPEEECRISRLDGRLVALLCEELAAAVEAAWPGTAPTGVALRCIRGSRDVASPDPREWTRAAFDVRVEGIRGRLQLFVPTSVALRDAPDDRSPSRAPGRLDAPGVRAAPVTATVRLGTWRTTLRELAELQPGSIIPLGCSPQSPLELSVAGVARLPVRPGTSNGRVSVQVTGGPLVRD